MTMVRRYERIDFAMGELAKPETTAEGYWRLEGKVARTGIQVYQDGAGGTRREYRSVADVKESLSGFALAPLTNGHPPALVNPSNAQQYASGAVGEATYADGWVKAPLTIWTKDAIDAVRAGRAQLSVGYQCQLVDEPGEYNGEKYDCRQTKIVVNHVALVDAARAGPEARLRLDAGDAASMDFFKSEIPVLGSEPTTRNESSRERTPMAYKMKLDGLEIEVADANAASIVERAITAAKKDGEDKASLEKARTDSVTAELAKVSAEKTALQAKADSLEAAAKVDVKCDECDGTGKISGEKCDDCGGKGEMKADSLLDFNRRKASRARSDARAASKEGTALARLLIQAGRYLSANENLDGKSAIEIKKLILAKVDKALKLDGKDDVYVNHRFEFEMEKFDKSQGKPIDKLRLVADPVVATDSNTDEVSNFDNVDEVRNHFRQRNHALNVKNKK